MYLPKYIFIIYRYLLFKKNSCRLKCLHVIFWAKYYNFYFYTYISVWVPNELWVPMSTYLIVRIACYTRYSKTFLYIGKNKIQILPKINFFFTKMIVFIMFYFLFVL